MRITIRLTFALMVAAALVVGASTFVQVRRERALLVDDLERRNFILADTLEDIIVPPLRARDSKKLERIAQKYGGRERLAGVAIFDDRGEIMAWSPDLDPLIGSFAPLPAQATQKRRTMTRLMPEHFIYVTPLRSGAGIVGAVALVRQASYIQARLQEVWRHNFMRLLVHCFLISLVTLTIVRWNVLSPIEQMTRWMQQVRAGETPETPPLRGGLLAPLASEASYLARSLSTARAVAEEEARLRQRAQSLWTAERLKEHVRLKLEGRRIFVVANREPYMHVREGKQIRVMVPASGLVTGIEPILRACGGMWIGHAAGDADRETADAGGKIAVPPKEPQYTLKRVWLSKEEEEGYYYGFSNEGLWPLCHIAHTRPIFRESDWRHYRAANRKFADAVLEEIAGEAEPLVLVQDYHFALLPRMIKDARPDARVALFWHIPWPNPEAFGICPWQGELLDGMLGADLVGFHIQFHCNNFLETVDRALECRIDWERFAVQRKGHSTAVKPFPISISFDEPGGPRAPALSKQALFARLGVQAELMGVGVDRVDYTKGIVERFRSVERFLEANPDYAGRFCFVELGAPSRTHITRYQDHMAEVEAEAQRINRRFASEDYRPIVFLKGHHGHEEIDLYYRAADLCMVTSLADGMNLVAKEFVAAREDERGALVLSRFTGAARELRDALIVNPYDIGQSAEAIRRALEMEPEEQARRMAGMRRQLRENNVYAWAARLIDDLAAVRLPAART